MSSSTRLPIIGIGHPREAGRIDAIPRYNPAVVFAVASSQVIMEDSSACKFHFPGVVQNLLESGGKAAALFKLLLLAV